MEISNDKPVVVLQSTIDNIHMNIIVTVTFTLIHRDTVLVNQTTYNVDEDALNHVSSYVLNTHFANVRIQALLTGSYTIKY